MQGTTKLSLSICVMPFATLSLASSPTVGQLNGYRKRARTFVAIDEATDQYVECVAWYSDEITDLPTKAPRFSRIMEKDAAISWGYIQ